MNPSARLLALCVADATREDLVCDGVDPGCRPLGRVAQPEPLLQFDGTTRADAAGSRQNFP